MLQPGASAHPLSCYYEPEEAQAKQRYGNGVKEFTKSNIYGANGQAALDLYSDYVSEGGSTLACVVSAHPLSDAARDAAESSMAALGYGREATFVVLTVDDITLSDQDLFSLLEGMDPLVVVATDAPTAAALSHAYRTDMKPGEACRLFGRDAVAFRDLESLLSTPEDKQRAWALFKKIPKLE